MKSKNFDIENIFGTQGLLAEYFSDYEQRPQQLQMAQAIQKSLGDKHHLAVEAGTGIGKSFAYLVCAIDAVIREKCKVLISTYTITLQEQLVNKDIPFLAKALGGCFSASLARGRNNFLCLRRLEFARRKQQGLFDASMDELLRLNVWASQTKEGLFSELDFVPSAAVLNAVKSEHGNCKARKCAYFDKCFYWKNRRRLATSDIIVANHAILFSDLALRDEGVSLLPDYKYMIIDEAHNIENVAQEHFGIDISQWRVNFILSSLYNPSTKKGLLAGTSSGDEIELVKVCEKDAKKFFEIVRKWFESNRGNGRIKKNFAEDCLSPSLKKLRISVAALAKKTDDEDEQFEFLRFAGMLKALQDDLQNFLSCSKDSDVYWVEVSDKKSRNPVTLRSAPINPGVDIKRCMFDKFESVILTSATLCCGGDSAKSGFGYFASRVGLEKYEQLKLGSPFDYENHVTMFIESEMPPPDSPTFLSDAAEKIKKYVTQTQGRAFVLFTSFQMLESVADMLSDWFSENGFELLVHGSRTDRTELLRRFRLDKKCILFGTDSFWQGVDVPGQALSNVIITKLPFAVPSHPLIEGRIEHLKSQGQNPFYSYQLPQAIIKFKQGFGRLIRSKNDTGIIVVLDSRIIQKSYGKEFLSAVEKCRVEIVGN
ncbi:MAG: helicase [Planctomycetaceae bacterium]|nr:helicase [Planctomycetaceae bacterium]